MKRIFLFILLLVGVNSIGQTVNQTLGGPTTLVNSKGGFKIDSALSIPKDTIMRNNWPKTWPAIAGKGDSLYLWSIAQQKWILIIGGSGGGSMVYPSAGIAVSTGLAWGTSITDNSSNWNDAYSWGNHASAGYEVTTNKATDFSIVNNTLYPTTQAVSDYVASSAPNLSNTALTANGDYQHDWALKNLHIKNIGDLYLQNDETELANNYFRLGPYSLGLGSYLESSEGDADITMGWGYDDLARRFVRTDLNAATGQRTSRMVIYGDSILMKYHDGVVPTSEFNYYTLLKSIRKALYINGDSLYITGLPTGSSSDSILVKNGGKIKAVASSSFATTGDLSGYQPLDADLTAISGLSGTNTIYYRSAANTWSPVTIGSNLTFSGGTLSATGGGAYTDADVENYLETYTGDVTFTGTTAAITAGSIVNADINASAAIDATKLIDGSITNTELGYINTLSSNAQTQLDGKQATLVSGTNIKTINGSSVLGSGDLSVSASAGGSSGQIQYNSGGALAGFGSWDGSQMVISSATARMLKLDASSGDSYMQFNTTGNTITTGVESSSGGLRYFIFDDDAGIYRFKINSSGENIFEHTGQQSLVRFKGSAREVGFGLDGSSLFSIYDYTNALYQAAFTADGKALFGGITASVSDAKVQVSGAVSLSEISEPATPSTGNSIIWVDASGNLNIKNDGGVNTTLGAGGGGGLTTGTTTITSGTNTRILYNNSGTLGEYTISGTGNVAMTTSPDFTTPTIGGVAIPSISSTHTIINKRITARVTSITSSATPTINTDNADAITITALATAITSMTTNLTGTPNNFDKILIRIKDDGTARAITWGASFASGVATLPTTTVLGKTLTVGLIYNTVSAKWECMAAGSEP
jgi:hypothetical protein